MRKMFSKNQIAEMIGDGLLEDKVVNVKEIIEEGDTELVDLSSYINTGFAKSNSIYAKLVVKHGILHLVISGKFVAGNAAGSNPTILNNFYEKIAPFASKIYRCDGTSVDKDPSSSSSINYMVCGNPLVKYTGTFSVSSYALLYSNDKENVKLEGFSFGTIAEDTACVIDFRIALTL